MSPNVLILTGSYGNGHLQVAGTIIRTLKQAGVQRVSVVDLFAEAHPVMTKFTRYLYIKSFTVGQHMYGRMFYSSQHMNHSRPVAKLLNSFGHHKMAELIDTVKPDIIINTFPMVNVPIYKAKTGSRIPTYHIITDYCLHNRWVHPLVDRYYVASQLLKKSLVARGIPEKAVYVSGIPVNSVFEETADREELCRRHGLDPQKELIVLMAGAHGVLQNTDRIARELINDHRQLVIVCGHNLKLKQKLETQLDHIPNVFIRGYVREMDQLMSIATVMVTKPGGITLTEALHTRLPLVLYRPVPGQELENALFFQKEGAAVKVDTIDELIQTMKHLLHNERDQQQMKKNMERLCKRQSAKVICEDILNHYEQHFSHQHHLLPDHKQAQ